MREAGLSAPWWPCIDWPFSSLSQGMGLVSTVLFIKVTFHQGDHLVEVGEEGVGRLLSACCSPRDKAPVRSEAPIPGMALPSTISSSEKCKDRRKHLCENKERGGDE